jgi:hypothetical protein
MRLLIAAPLLLLGACQVTDENNGATTVAFNEDVAREGAADVANTAEDIAGKIGNDVEQGVAKVENKVGDVDVDIDVDRKEKPAVANTN